MRVNYIILFLLFCSFFVSGEVSRSVKDPFFSLREYDIYEANKLVEDYIVPQEYLTTTDCQVTFSDTSILNQTKVLEQFYDQLPVDVLINTKVLFDRYAPHIRKSLYENQLSACLQLLPIVLSGMNSTYSSSRNTNGLWQLSYPVAVRFGLNLDRYVDERYDPELSTDAFIKYFKYLKNQYGSTELAIIAFLTSPSELNFALNKSGFESFEKLYPFLPLKTRDLFLAYQVMNYKFIQMQKKAILMNFSEKKVELDTLSFDEELLTKIFVKYTKVDSSVFSSVNPTFIGQYMPSSDLGYKIWVPKENKRIFYSIKDSIYKQQQKYLKPPLPKPISPPTNSQVTFYTVRSGDVLGSIATRYGTSVSKLKYWNRLSTDRINVGQKLKVYVSEKSYKPKPNTSSVKTKKGQIIIYTVKSGDNLWSISRKYPGVSSEDIMELNNIDENIDVGQKIKIKVP